MAANEEIELELEALESIYVDELVKLSDGSLRIRIDPEDEAEAAEFEALLAAERDRLAKEAEKVREEDKTGKALEKSSQAPKKVDEPDEPEEDPNAPDPILSEPTLWLQVTYPSGYPDEVPTLALLGNPLITDAARDRMIASLKEVAEESLGMAMVFTLTSHMRESLTAWIKQQLDESHAEENDRREAEIEAENAKFRGTAVTKEGFLQWHAKFVAEKEALALAAEEEKVRGMSAKAKEEYRRYKAKPTGRDLFTKGVALDASDDVGDADAKEIDWSLYDRATRDREREAWEDQQNLQDSMDQLEFDED